MTDTTLTESGGQLLVQDVRGRVRTPREKREQILDEYERSGMSGMAFAAMVGVKYPTLASWVQQRRKRQAVRASRPAAEATVRWVEAVAESEPRGAASGGRGLRVQIGTGVWLEVTNGEQAAWAGQMLRAMGVARC